jgi:hypothetical protein
MYNAGGYARTDGPDGKEEHDTFTCNHCNRIVHCKNSKLEALGGVCKLCMRHICVSCINKGCVPFEKKLDLYEKRQAFLRSIEKV